MRVLVTGAGALLGQGIIRSLRDSDLDPYIIAADPSPLSPGLYWADEWHLVPMATDPDYLPQAKALIERVRPDAVLVGTDVELELFAEHREDLERRFGCHIIVSSPEVVRIADDKYLTAEFLRKRSLPFCRSVLPHNSSELIEELGFPLVVKPRIGARAVGFHVVSSEAELAAALDSVVNPVVQEYLHDETNEYTAGALVFDGTVEGTIVMRRDLRDGNTCRAYVDSYPDLNKQVSQLAEALQPYGPANFQFRIRDGEAVVFEINGRFSGTTHFRTRVGFNEVEYTLRRVALKERPTLPPITPKIVLRHFTETIIDPVVP